MYMPPPLDVYVTPIRYICHPHWMYMTPPLDVYASPIRCMYMPLPLDVYAPPPPRHLGHSYDILRNDN